MPGALCENVMVILSTRAPLCQNRISPEYDTLLCPLREESLRLPIGLHGPTYFRTPKVGGIIEKR